MFQLIKRIYSLAGSLRKKLYLANIFQFIQAFCEAGNYMTVYAVILSLLSKNFTKTHLLRYSLILVGLLLIRYFCEYGVNRLQCSAGYEIMEDVRMEEATKLKHLPMRDFLGEGLGKLLSIFTTDINFVEMYCISPIARFVSGMSIALITTIMMLMIDVRMALLAVSGFLPAFLVYRHSKKMFAISGKLRQESQAEAISGIIEYISQMETVRSCGLGGKTLSHLDDKLKDYKKLSTKYELKAIAPMTIYQMLVRVGMGLLFLFGILFYFNGTLSLEKFLFFAVISAKYYQPIETIFLDYGVLNLMGISLNQIESLSKKQPLQDTGKELPKSADVAFENVSFGYMKDIPVLQNITTSLSQNAFYAIVGRSGSGKTTMIQLIARFWDVDTGSIRIGTEDIRQIPYDSLLKHISMVFQDVYLFEGTIYENIALGRQNATREEVLQSAQDANCHNFIEKLPKGYDTLVGEAGNTLSGGERQRIAIARAILKNAPIILLDEALSSIDPENAYEIQQAIDRMTSEKTVLMIAHTLSHIRHADGILVLNSGKLTGFGKHSQLLQTNRDYKTLWEQEQASKEWRLVREKKN